MEANYSNYNYEASIQRITNILDEVDTSFSDRESIPSRDSLTFNNGFYVKCSAVFIDMRDSKSLTDTHEKPVLAKIYKAFISELVAVLNGHLKVHEVYIEGDCVWGIFNTTEKKDINELLETVAQASSLIDILNIKLRNKGYAQIEAGIGAAWGTALLIKAGHNGSGINEVVWLGELVAEAAKLCSEGKKTIFNSRVMISNDFRYNLKTYYQNFFTKNIILNCYEANICNIVMNEWVNKNG